MKTNFKSFSVVLLFSVLTVGLLAKEVSANDLFVGGGMSIGQSRREATSFESFAFTDKRRLPSKDVGIQAFPFLENERIGFSYGYQWNEPLKWAGQWSTGAPSSTLERKWQMHSIGAHYRFVSKGIQPSVGAGVTFYSEDYSRTLIVLGFFIKTPQLHYGTEGVWFNSAVKVPVKYGFFVEPTATVLVSPVNSFSSLSVRVLYNFKMPKLLQIKK